MGLGMRQRMVNPIALAISALLVIAVIVFALLRHGPTAQHTGGPSPDSPIPFERVMA
jgi:hypothetical protein